MADLVDKTAEADFTEAAVHYARTQPRSEVPRGRCLNCSEQLEKDKIYCDEYCKYDYERRAKC